MFSLFIFLNIALALVSNIDNSKYEINYRPSKISRSLTNSLLALNPTLEGDFHIMKISNTSYLCFIPPKEDEEIDDIEIDETRLKTEALNILNSEFLRSDCLFSHAFNGGYWTFGYCFGDKVIQFHEDLTYFIENKIHKPENPNTVYILGRFPDGPKGSSEIQNEAKNYNNELKVSDFILNEHMFVNEGTTAQVIQHTLNFGETCDLTKKPRNIEVIYKCDMHNTKVEIVDIQEIRTCNYQMIINVPRLCQLSEFVPYNYFENLVEIDCKLIGEEASGDEVLKVFQDNAQITEEENNPNPVTEIVQGVNEIALNSTRLKLEFFNHSYTLPNQTFPVLNDSKINLRDYSLLPCGWGFFFGNWKLQQGNENTYWNHRTILVFNDDFSTKEDLMLKVSSFFASIMNLSIPSPVLIQENVVRALSWQDKFIIWYELYDFYGQFISMVRVERDPIDNKVLLVLLVNPETMKDQDDEFVEVGTIGGIQNAWNYEMFEGFKITEIKIVDEILDQNAENKGSATSEDHDNGNDKMKDYKDNGREGNTKPNVVTITHTESVDNTVTITQTNTKETDIIAQLAAELGIHDLESLKQQFLYQFSKQSEDKLEKTQEANDENLKDEGGPETDEKSIIEESIPSTSNEGDHDEL
jgi:protein OS-9